MHYLFIVLTLIDLIPVPAGWERFPAISNSFGEYIQHLPFEPTDSTFFWDGTKGIYHSVAAVHKLNHLTENQQCADIIMRLYSDYKIGRGEAIQWHDVNGKLKIYPGGNYNQFMTDIYNYSNTYSLYKFDSYPIKFSEMQAGDILVIPGFPGHAIIIADILKKDGDMEIAVVEGFMPAVQPFLYKTDELHSKWNNGINVSGYHFDENNLRRIY